MSYISIVATLSREDQQHQIVTNLAKLLERNELTGNSHTFELIIAIDNKKIQVYTMKLLLVEILARYQPKNIVVFNSGNPPPKKMDMVSRRNRIARLRNMTKDEIGGSDFVFSFEDDTILPVGAIENLVEDWKRLDNPGFIQGVQIGRWGHSYIGGWRVDNIQNPEHYETVLPSSQSIDTIDAGGFYCYLTSTQLYKSVDYDWQEPCGPDVAYGLKLRQLGYNNYIDYRLLCGHIDREKIIYPVFSEVVRVTIDKTGNRWRNAVLKT